VSARPVRLGHRRLSNESESIEYISFEDSSALRSMTQFTVHSVLQLGAGPRRIDILTRIDGVSFAAAYERRLTVQLEGISVPVISREDLIANKRASGRTQDLADLERLIPRVRSRDKT
jgi:hypothetical protein